MSRAKSLRGLRGNILFTIKHKTWAAIAIAAAGAVLGAALLAPEAFGHSGGVADDGCHRDRSAGERHWHLPDTRTRAGECVEEAGQTIRYRDTAQAPGAGLQESLDRLDAAIEAEASRPPRVMRIEVPEPRTPECQALRKRFQEARWGWRDADAAAAAAAAAIAAGCW